MNIEEAEKTIAKMEKKHHISKWFALIFGAWIFSLPFLPDSFPYLNWLRAEDPSSLYIMIGVFCIVWSVDNWRTTKELKLLKATLELGKKFA
ncbi:hypothetical protein [Teredinibacter purpureus]|uniref:hypothetical protein n=1 Tax=Teredinibacter purpureus TaxID=2731756 RepID=UPI0005F7A7AF|nr:hypothetical protein [Teredinibacter purpureus]